MNYATMTDFEQALKRALSGLPDNIETGMRMFLPSLVNNIRTRVATTGKNADGEAFSTPYSRSQTYKRSKYGKGTLGRQTAYKGFYYQGTMWNNFVIGAIVKSNTRISSKLSFAGNNTYLTNAKLNEIHSIKENIAISAPNKEEGLRLTREIGKNIGDYLKSVL